MAVTLTSLVYFMNENTLSHDYYVVKLTYFDRLRSTDTHVIIMATMKIGTICNIHGSNDD